MRTYLKLMIGFTFLLGAWLLLKGVLQVQEEWTDSIYLFLVGATTGLLIGIKPNTSSDEERKRLKRVKKLALDVARIWIISTVAFIVIALTVMIMTTGSTTLFIDLPGFLTAPLLLVASGIFHLICLNDWPKKPIEDKKSELPPVSQ